MAGALCFIKTPDKNISTFLIKAAGLTQDSKRWSKERYCLQGYVQSFVPWTNDEAGYLSVPWSTVLELTCT
jgi:hypothetical protein